MKQSKDLGVSLLVYAGLIIMAGFGIDPATADETTNHEALQVQTNNAKEIANAQATAAGELITNSIGMQMKLIQPGTFIRTGIFTKGMHEVTITKPFYMGIYPVTQEQWHQVMGTKRAYFKGPDRPVDRISWDDAQTFLKKLSEKEGVKYRLPTEAEWEYACRAGTQTAYYWGDEWADDHGWCATNVNG